MSSKRCPSCGVYSPATSEHCDCGQSLSGVSVGATRSQGSAIEAAGLFLMGLGVALWIFCFAVFDVSIEVPDTSAANAMQRIANIERLDKRQSGITIGAALFVAGAVLFASGSTKTNRG